MPVLRPLEPGVRRFSAHVRRLQRCCLRVEKQLHSGNLRVSDVELVYTSSFLAMVTRWEAFVEAALYEAVCTPAPKALRIRRHLAIASRSHLQRILLHPDKEYVSLTTVRQARDVYELFLKGAGPFGGISDTNQTYIQQAIWIRNAIAHASAASDRAFKKKVPGVASLPRNRRQPSAFLRHEFRVAPSQRRFDLYCSAFLSAATEMGDDWSAAS